MFTPRNYIRIVLPDPVHNNYGIEIYSDNAHDVKVFEKKCLALFDRYRFGTFFQGGHDSTSWRYFEFWYGADKQDEILDISMKIAEHFSMELEIF